MRVIAATTSLGTPLRRTTFAGVDTSVIALWLGHVSVETTQICGRARGAGRAVRSSPSR